MTKQIEVVCGILIQDQKVLVTQRSAVMALPLKWEFPGGKKEPLESDEECLQREILEELNLLISVKERFLTTQHDYPHMSVKLTAYFMEYQSGTVLLIEHNRFAWIAKTELLSLNWADADIPIVNSLINTAKL